MILDPSITGDTFTGQREPARGAIYDLDVDTIGYGSADVTFAQEIDNPTSHEIGMYVDGELAARLPATSISAGIAGLIEGEHTISLHINLIGEAWPDYHGDPEGQRAYLSWSRCNDSSCREYRVYWDAGSGGAVATLLAQISGVEISEAINRKGAEGESGRISWYGGFSADDPVNDLITLTLTNTGGYSYSCLAGSGSGNFSPGQTLILPYGVIIEVQDAVSAYGAVSTFSIPVGPAPHFLSDELTPGDYQFCVTALDAAGNESVVSDTRLVRIYDVPPALPGVYMAWNAATEQMSVGWNVTAAQAAGIVTVSVYSNICLGYADHVINDVPMQSLPVSAGAVVFSRSAIGDGLVKLYMRPVDAAGNERTAVSLVQFTMPAQPLDQGITLGVATNVQLLPKADGAFEATWDYRFDEEHDDLTGFEVAIASSSGGQTFSGTAQVAADDGSGYPVGSYSLTLTGPYSGTYYVVVRAFAGTTANTDSIEASGVADATPPAFDPDLYGVSQ